MIEKNLNFLHASLMFDIKRRNCEKLSMEDKHAKIITTLFYKKNDWHWYRHWYEIWQRDEWVFRKWKVVDKKLLL